MAYVEITGVVFGGSRGGKSCMFEGSTRLVGVMVICR